MAKSFLFSTTGTKQTIKFEELGAYFEHPISAYTLSDYFDMYEIEVADTIQFDIDNGYIIATDENGNIISSLEYLTKPTPVFATDNITRTKTYIGYGTSGTCKIQEVISSSNGTYTAFWASGNESFNKIWSGRTNYSYF